VVEISSNQERVVSYVRRLFSLRLKIAVANLLLNRFPVQTRIEKNTRPSLVDRVFYFLSILLRKSVFQHWACARIFGIRDFPEKTTRLPPSILRGICLSAGRILGYKPAALDASDGRPLRSPDLWNN
jgi:hypothetical protein